jgi:hypothetical protein
MNTSTVSGYLQGNLQIRLIYNTFWSQQVEFARGSLFSHRVNHTDPRNVDLV